MKKFLKKYFSFTELKRSYKWLVSFMILLLFCQRFKWGTLLDPVIITIDVVIVVLYILKSLIIDWVNLRKAAKKEKTDEESSE